MSAADFKPATARQVQAWRERTGHSVATASAEFGVHPRTFARWLAGDSVSPKWLGDRFRTEGVR